MDNEQSSDGKRRAAAAAAQRAADALAEMTAMALAAGFGLPRTIITCTGEVAQWAERLRSGHR